MLISVNDISTCIAISDSFILQDNWQFKLVKLQDN